MILSRGEILSAVEAGELIIEPFEASLVNPNSYNYHLSDTIRIHESNQLDAFGEQSIEEVVIPRDGYVLRPGCVYLGLTLETIGSSTYVPSLIGRSSMGRLGLFLQVSADLGNLGAIHQWTLELVAVQPVRIYRGMRIGQVSFWQVRGEHSAYRGFFGAKNFAEVPTADSFNSDRPRGAD